MLLVGEQTQMDGANGKPVQARRLFPSVAQRFVRTAARRRRLERLG
jgi:hypothetical protein